jgi:YD repeat-containing protein
MASQLPTDYPIAGDGRTPTAIQYLDIQGYSIPRILSLASDSSKGDAMYQYALDLPSALLKPRIALHYSSAGGPDLEMPYGWALNGILEIRRPLARAYAACEFKTDCTAAEWLIGGAEFSGTLKPSGARDYRYFLRTSEPRAVTAKYFNNKNLWEVYSNAITWTLSPADNGADTPDGTALWRVTQMEDTFGNYVSYSYHSDGRIKKISYGGKLSGDASGIISADAGSPKIPSGGELTSGPVKLDLVGSEDGEDHLVDVVFDYGDNTATRTNARAGFVVEYDQHVESITVKPHGNVDTSKNSWGTMTDAVERSGVAALSTGLSQNADERWYAYDLIYTVKDSLDLLTTLEREGKSPDNAETIARFNYSEHLDEVSGTSSTVLPSNLGATWGYTESYNSSGDNWRNIYLVSVSGVSQVLADFNRDGLPDVMDASHPGGESAWLLDYQTVDSARSFGWSEPYNIYPPQLFLQEPEIYLSKLASDTPENIDEYFREFTEQRAHHLFTDVDGDGYMDVIETRGTDVWAVHYGTGGGFDNESEPNPPSGWTYPQYNQSFNATRSSNANSLIEDDTLKTLIDLDGDGWLDAYDPDEAQVYYHTGTRGGGWEQTARMLNRNFDSIRRVKYTIGSIKPYGYGEVCANACQNGCAYDTQSACGDTTWYNCEEWKECYEDCAVDNCRADEGYEVAITGEDSASLVSLADQYYISNTDEVSAFLDINGDGLVDFVDAVRTPWQVSLNNGHGFEEDRAWPAPVSYMRRTEEGYPDIYKKGTADGDGFTRKGHYNILADEGKETRLYQMLVDVDGDGLLDLALGKEDDEGADLGKKWYKNTGSGFETDSRDLPGWWPDNFMTATSKVTQEAGQPTLSVGTTTSLMIDLNHDGAIDSLTTDQVSYGPYPRPYLLTKVENGQGGQTEIAYRPMSTVEPSGQPTKLQHTPNVKDLVDVMTTTDTLTGQDSESSFEYSHGYFVDGVFRGFETRDTELEVNGTWTSKTAEEYDLDADLPPLTTKQKLYTDGNRNFAPSLARGSVLKKLRYESAKTFSDSGGASRFHLIKTHEVTGYGESGGAQTATHSYTWDDYGNLTGYGHNGGGRSDDAVTVNMRYVADEDELFFRMATKMVSGTDPLDGVYRTVEYERYYYDGNATNNPVATLTKGSLSKTQTSSGWPLGGGALDDDILEITFDRGPRGELASITDENTGETIDQTFGFGGAILKTQTNNLGQTLTRTVDKQGRITSIRDDNGLIGTNTYDDFSRVTKKQITDREGVERTLSITEYFHNLAPFTTKTMEYDDSGGIDKMGYAVEDGFARVTQQWFQNEAGTFLKTNALQDLRGFTVSTSHPKNAGASFSRPSSFTTIPSNVFEKTYYDALGSIREKVSDSAAAIGSRTISFDSPRVEVREDEEGYKTKLTFDAHHRVKKVEQGLSSHYTTTAQYQYDPLNRLVKFHDGNGVCYAYSYDGAGRLRQVKHGKRGSLATAGKQTLSPAKSSEETSSCVASTLWYSYEYDGRRKTKMTDATGAYTSWQHDAIGRLIAMTVSDSLPSSPGSLNYTWDYDDAWIGALYQATDPAGTITYTYDSLGQVRGASRVFNPSVAGVSEATFTYVRDLQGRLMSRTLPSGRVVADDYDHGFLAKTTAATSGAIEYTVDYDYTDWGAVSLVESSFGHVFSNWFTTPLHPDKSRFRFGSRAYEREYSWHENGLLKSLHEIYDSAATAADDTAPSTSLLSMRNGGFASSGASGRPFSSLSGAKPELGSGSTFYSYSYDALKELTLVKTPLRMMESYSYDEGGNLKTMQDRSGIAWTYTAAGALNKISARTPSSGDAETYTYDAAGRVATWENTNGTYTYYYDGQGRLRGVTLGGVWQMILDYDVDGNLVRRGDNNPYTSLPSYSYAFEGWRYDERSAIVTEFDTPFVATEDGSRRWMFSGYDGSPTMIFADDGSAITTRSFGAFGDEWGVSGAAWNWDSFHGAEAQGELFHMGQRHLMQKDGQWLQPEPLLYSGIGKDHLADPLALSTFRYGRNTPTVYQDRSGMDPAEMVVAERSGSFLERARTLVVFDNETSSPSTFLGRAVLAFERVNAVEGRTNCASTMTAGALTLLGMPAHAKLIGSRSISGVEYVFGRTFQKTDMDGIVAAATQGGAGFVGLIVAEMNVGNGKMQQHGFLVTNIPELNPDGDGVIFLDTQHPDKGAVLPQDLASYLSGYDSLSLMPLSGEASSAVPGI